MEATIKVERSQSPPQLAIEPSNLVAITGTTIELPCQADQPEDGLQVNSLTGIGHGIGNFLFTRHLLTFPFWPHFPLGHRKKCIPKLHSFWFESYIFMKVKVIL